MEARKADAMCYRKRRKNVDRYVPALPKGLCIWRRSDLFYLERAEAVGEFLPRRVDGHTRGAYSHGCVRLSDADLSYINNTCPMGTTVVSY